MKHSKIKLSSAFFLLQALIVGFLLIIIGLFFSMYFNKVVEEHGQKLLLRSSLFKSSVSENVVLGDYSSALKRSSDFFDQGDVRLLRIKLIDGTDVAFFQKDKSGKSDSVFRTEESVNIESNIDKSINKIASIEVIYDLATLHNLKKDLVKKGMLAGLFSFLLSSLVIFYFSKSLRRPLESMSETFATGDLRRISNVEPESFVHEMWVLEKSISTLGKQIIELNEKERELAKSAAVGRITSQLSHDMRSPLGTFERLLMVSSDEFMSMKSAIKDSLNRLYSMTDALRNSEAENLVKRSRSIVDFSFGKHNLLLKAHQRGISIVVPEFKIQNLMIDAIKFERAWMNLASNAIEVAKSYVRVEVEVSDSDFVLRVIDDGLGVPTEFLPRLFQRGATHGKHDGTGLGLAYVRQIMRGHGGDVTYRREKNLTIFECRLPNAVIDEKEQVVENVVSLEHRLDLKAVRNVALCLEPRSLNLTILDKLASYDSVDFSFTEERTHASIVVSNNDDIMIEVLERDDQEYVALGHLKGDEMSILKTLKRKFALDNKGGGDV